jgi:transcriptional regulator with XRE-family HTH domain
MDHPSHLGGHGVPDTPGGSSGPAPFRSPDAPDPRAVTDQEWMEALGRRLARFRKARGFTQGEAAERAALSRRTVHRAERGENPTLLTVVRLLRVYDRLDALAALVPADPERRRWAGAGPTAATGASGQFADRTSPHPTAPSTHRAPIPGSDPDRPH